ncbi:helix-turn-helix domain-containing protein [Kitasatospora sp. NPDC049258]|uniref:helix-turn-helix domain-containing protein n=1 Tax=Kitasatospora sp. NPDC049258 TaxID=3155394 RepID=UPI0034269AF0
MPRRQATITALPTRSTTPQPDALPLPARYLTPENIAELFEVPLETVYQWRRKRTGPPGFRVGRHVRYHPAAVAQWVAAQSEAA